MGGSAEGNLWYNNYMGRNKTFWWIGVIVVILFAILIAPQFSGKVRDFRKRLALINADCIGNEGQNLAQDIHQTLKIIVDGVEQVIPANVGIISSCTAEVHTHDTTGLIHIETLTSGKTFKLKDFFTIWGEQFDRPGYEMNMTVNGNPDGNLSELVLKNEQQIVLIYSKPQQ